MSCGKEPSSPSEKSDWDQGYSLDDTKSLVDAAREGESLEDLEGRLSETWIISKKEAGFTQEEILQEVMEECEKEIRGSE